MVSHTHTGANLGAALIGYSFMGAVHAHAWQAAPRFFSPQARPEVKAVAGRTQDAVAHFAGRFRIATGRKNALRIEINGSAGSIAFDFENFDEPHVYDAERPSADAIAAGHQPRPSFADGRAVQRVLEAVEHSAAHNATWTPIN